MSKPTIEDFKKRIKENSLHIGELTPETKTRFKKLAEGEFTNHYGWTLKWLLDFRDGIMTGPGEETKAIMTSMMQEIENLKLELKEIKDDIKPENEKKIQTLGGRKLR